MRHQNLSGFSLHQRRYRERSHIVHFFSRECGRVDGVLRQQPPALYHFCTLQANGKSELKNFSQLDVQGQPFYLQQRALFAGFYLNEILIKLLVNEDPMPKTFDAYRLALAQLKGLPGNDAADWQLKWILRRFEWCLLDELGYTIDFFNDYAGKPLEQVRYYEFMMLEGFRASEEDRGWLGQHLIAVGRLLQQPQQGLLFDEVVPTDLAMYQPILGLLGKLYRDMINQLLGQKPLKSRQLWQSQLS